MTLKKSQAGTAAASQRLRRKDGADRRANFIDVAISLFSGRPYAQVSVDEIAEQAGVTKGLLYYYFGDKQGLYVAALQRLASELQEQLTASAKDDTAPPLQRLMQGLDAHLAFIERYPDGYRELIGSAASHPEVQAIFQAGQNTIRELILANLPPEVPLTPTITLAVKGWGTFVDGVELAWLADGGSERDHVRELCSRVLVSAIAAAIEVDKKDTTSGG